jgi:uncharacterized protein YciI
MKKLLLVLLFLQVFQLNAQNTKSPAPAVEQYWFVMIKTGPNAMLDSLQKNDLFKGHMANMKRLADEGILKIAGPFGKNDFSWRGISIFDCKTFEEAQQHVNTDPAVKAGLFEVDIVPWYSSPEGNLQHTNKPMKP